MIKPEKIHIPNSEWQLVSEEGMGKGWYYCYARCGEIMLYGGNNPEYAADLQANGPVSRRCKKCWRG